MSISPKQTKSFTSKEVQIQINTFLKEINTALSSIDIFEDSEMISLRNNTDNDEKYHTVKVSCLDELNRKAVLYDAFIEKACEWLISSFDNLHNEYGRKLDFGNQDVFIEAFKKAMEE